MPKVTASGDATYTLTVSQKDGFINITQDVPKELIEALTGERVVPELIPAAAYLIDYAMTCVKEFMDGAPGAKKLETTNAH